MSIPDNELSNGRVKTLGIRFEPDIHADMTLIASLRGTSFQAEVLEACRAHVATVKASPELASKADDALAEIEREAAARREAFARLFGSTPDMPDEEGKSSPTGAVFRVTTEGLAAAVEHERTSAAANVATTTPPTPTTSRKSAGQRGGDSSKS